jgi:hypothetical protein
MTASLREGTQARRLLDWLRANPGSSSLEMTLALGIVNTTGRISDIRASGVVVDCREDKAGVARYRIVDPEPVQVALFFAEAS